MRRLALAAAVAAALAAATAAWASVPEPVQGTFAAPPPVPDRIWTADGNCFVELDDRFVLAGPLAGTLELDLRLAFHGPCFASRGEFHASGTFAGTATAGGVARSGTAEAAFNGLFAAGRAEGTLVLHGSGIHAVVTLAGTPGVGGTYAGTLHLEPA